MFRIVRATSLKHTRLGNLKCTFTSCNVTVLVEAGKFILNCNTPERFFKKKTASQSQINLPQGFGALNHLSNVGSFTLHRM